MTDEQYEALCTVLNNPLIDGFKKKTEKTTNTSDNSKWEASDYDEYESNGFFMIVAYSNEVSISIGKLESHRKESRYHHLIGDWYYDVWTAILKKFFNGQILYSDHLKIDTDYDTLEDGEEVKMCNLSQYTILDTKVPSYILKAIPYHYIFTEISDPMKVDTDEDGYKDYEDVIPLSILNYGSIISLEEDKITKLQIALEHLGYLDMMGNKKGSYGGYTKSALNIYRLNHNIVIQDQIDDFSYAVILNDYYLKSFDNAKTIYEGQLLDVYKPFSEDSYSIQKPLISYSEINNGICINKVSNACIKDPDCWQNFDIWLYDFTKPILNALENEEDKFYKHQGNKIWFYNQVKTEGPWDIKLLDKWNVKFPGCTFVSSSFPFVFEDKIISPENLGNITYGYLGLACRFNLSTLFWGGDFASLLSNHTIDSNEDKDYVEYGYNIYKIKYPKAGMEALANSLLIM